MFPHTYISVGFLFASLSLSCDAFCQVLPLQYYTSQDGLLANGTSTLLQDSHGYLWVGTAEGISVYDGENFTSYRTNDGLTQNHVTCLMESRHEPGVMWIGTLSGGLNKFTEGTFTVVPLDSARNSEDILALVEDQFGTIWCGTARGVYTIRNDSAARFPLDFEQLHELEIVAAPDSTVWIGIDQTIFIHSPTGQTTVRHDLALEANEFVASMFADQNGSVWFATTADQILQFRNRNLVAQRRLDVNGVHQMFDDAHDRLWLATDHGVLQIMKSEIASGKITQYTTANGLRENFVNCGLFDRENNLWLGSFSKGLCKLANPNLLSFPLMPLQKGQSFHPPATADRNGHFWIISGDGLLEIWNHRERDWRQHLHRFNEQDQKTMNSVAADLEGRLWVGSWNGTLYCHQILSNAHGASRLVRSKKVELERALPDAGHLGLLVDPRKYLWLSVTDVGVVQIDIKGKPEFMTILTRAEGLPDHAIRALYQDRERNLWFGGYEGGLAVLRAGEKDGPLHKFTLAEGLPDEHVRAIHQDREGRMWIGTRDGGLALYTEGKFRGISVNDGLISNTIWSITEDDNGRLWLGTALGLQALDKKSARPLPAGNDQRLGAVHACGVFRNTWVWMATAEAFTIYDFAGEAPNRTPPLIHITQVQMNGKAVNLRRTREFSHDQNTCAIAYAGLSLRDEKAVRYRYRISGIVQAWSTPVAQRAVTFANLAPGTYTFEVQAMNNDGVPSAQPAAVTFTILPPIHATWWFRMLALTAVAGLVTLVYRYRVSRLLEMERLRVRIASDLHDDIGATLTKISLHSELIQDGAGAPEVRTTLRKIGTMSRELVTTMSDVVWSIDARNDTVGNLLDRMREFAASVLSAKSVAFNFTTMGLEPHKKLSVDIRQNLYLIFKEAINNVARHAEASQVNIRLENANGAFKMIIHDDGQVLAETEKLTGHGLRNMKMRAERIGGDLEILRNGGYTVSLIAPALH